MVAIVLNFILSLYMIFNTDNSTDDHPFCGRRIINIKMEPIFRFTFNRLAVPDVPVSRQTMGCRQSG